MTATAQPAPPRVLHTLPGRLRVHLSEWDGSDPERLAARLAAIAGVRRATATPATGNVLLRYDEQATDADALVAALQGLPLAPRVPDAPETDETAEAAERPPAEPGRSGAAPRRVRIAVRGVDRDPAVARRVVARLRRRPGVRRVKASALTGRVLVEFSEDLASVEDLLSLVSDVELPDETEADHPAHPLDPAPLIQSSARLIGAGAGLAFVLARRVAGGRGIPVGGAAVAAGLAGAAEGLPPVRRGLSAALGHDGAQLVLGGTSIVALTLSASPAGLALAAAGALRMYTEVRARRAAWAAYEERLGDAPSQAGELARLEPGQRAPLRARVVEGTGTAVGHDGLPHALAPGEAVDAGARVFGGPYVVELIGGRAFAAPPPRSPPAATAIDRYVDAVGLVSLGLAAATLIVTRSPGRALTTLLLVNPRPAAIGADAADKGASARVLRAGVTVVGTRPERVVRRCDAIVVDSPRIVADAFELAGIVPLAGGDRDELGELVTAVAGAAASPWGDALRGRGALEATGGDFDGERAVAEIGGRRYELAAAGPDVAGAAPPRRRGEHLLALRGPAGEALALVALRPRPAPGLQALIARCRASGTELVLSAPGDGGAAAELARRTGLPPPVGDDALALVRGRQRDGGRVALVADGAHAAEALEAADLGIGLSSGRSGAFPARADLLAPDLSAVAAVVDAGVRREQAVGASIVLSLAANVVGVAVGARGAPALTRASTATYGAALGAIAAGWALLRGGARSRSVAARLVDPRPERWARRDPAEVLRALDSSPRGLSAEEADARRPVPRRAGRRAGPLTRALAAQLRSPLVAVLGTGAVVSLMIGAAADVPIIGAVVVANAAIGAWQERQAGRASDALAQMAAATARVLRDGEERSVGARAVVPGDVLVLSAGDRVVADARLLRAEGLEVDEAALTGESLPVRKRAEGGSDAARIVLEGSDVTVGRGWAVVVAVGRGTRLGATAAALELDGPADSPLHRRLGRLLGLSLPVAAAGGALVALPGLLRGRPPLAQAAIGASAAIAAVPEGLPLLAGVAESAVARRLALRRAYVRRLTAVEALGRVDVACFDKTGTLTEGRLKLTRVVALDGEARPPGEASGRLREVLAAAAIASPHPDRPGARSHPTDVAVAEAAAAAGLADELTRPREREAPFEPARSFHATVSGSRLRVKGAAEVLVPRCTAVQRGDRRVPLDDAGRAELLRAAERLSAEGLRVLMVATRRGGAVKDPRDLVALGFVGISDPLRAGAADAIRRCHAAGVRPVMLTGDHPATARAIADAAGLAPNGRAVLTGDDFARLDDAELDERLEGVEVIARITPLDKLRIVESLKRRRHTVAMTGDGVNDAPALRLADVGVAMGAGGTDVARQAADVVLGDDDLATLVEALVEGRGFWRNMRRALALLLGGNLGELGLMAGAGALMGVPLLRTRQILTINLVTDVLPALAVAMQGPEHRDLAGLTREGAAALDDPLRADILRRGAATAVPALAAALLAGRVGDHPPTVGFAAVVGTQLAQTLDVGRAEGRLTPSVVGAVLASGGVLALALLAPPARAFLGLAAPGAAGLALIGGASLLAPSLSRTLQGTTAPAAA